MADYWSHVLKEGHHPFNDNDDDAAADDDGDGDDGQVNSVSYHREIHLSCPSSPLGAIIMFPFNIIIF